jgi:hypothetical protein
MFGQESIIYVIFKRSELQVELWEIFLFIKCERSKTKNNEDVMIILNILPRPRKTTKDDVIIILNVS